MLFVIQSEFNRMQIVNIHLTKERRKIMEKKELNKSPFETIKSEKIKLGRFNVVQDEVRVNGNIRPYDYLEMMEGVSILPFHGKNIITKIADYEGNYVKESGLLEGDEIIAINEIPIKMISLEEDAELSRQDTLIYDIVRQGKSYKIPVVIDKKEVQGD